jgi:hypothetical protein
VHFKPTTEQLEALNEVASRISGAYELEAIALLRKFGPSVALSLIVSASIAVQTEILCQCAKTAGKKLTDDELKAIQARVHGLMTAELTAMQSKTFQAGTYKSN